MSVHSFQPTVNSPKKSVHRELSTVYRRSTGFTLIELLIVITILGILAGITLASYGNAQAKSRDSRRKTDLDAIKKALELKKQDSTGAYYYPNTANDATLAPSYIQKVPTDPKTAVAYIYAPTPANCTTTSICTTYTLTACLENGNDPQGVTDATNCPTPPNKAYTVTPN